MNHPARLSAVVAVVAVMAGAQAVLAQRDAFGDRYDELRVQRRERDQTIWAQEQAAQAHEQFFVRIWDELLGGADPREALGGVAFLELHLGPFDLHDLRAHDGEVIQFPAPGGPYDRQSFGALLERLERQGYRLEETEWHHAAFDIDEEGRAESTVGLVMHVTNAAKDMRYQLKANLKVRWPGRAGTETPRLAERIEVTDLRVGRWSGPPAFKERFSVSLEHKSPMDDVLTHDVNGDGRSDIVYPSANLVYINEGDFEFTSRPLCADAPQIVAESAFADLNGDGHTDFLCAGVTPLRYTLATRMRLYLYPGDGTGTFDKEPTRLGPGDLELERPECFTLGDVDADGDLDLWIAQYKSPYIDGQFPEPYYDANDGYPSYLFLNDGKGNLTDATAAAGLAEKRHRRTFRSSFVDFDDDGDLDLVVVSDFAGISVHANDGAGHFADVTASVISEHSAFGMSHTFADFDTDGNLDIYVTGMGSTTARRLERMGLGRDDLPDYQDARMRIGYGNRMYLRRGTEYFIEPDFKDDVARSGWAWGCTTLDYDSDGDPDIYVSNGNMSGRSTRDYCTTFWCHDIYTGSAREDPALHRLFSEDMKLLSSRQISWNGYEHNRLFRNDGSGFNDVAFGAGVAVEADCRATLTDDFDLDGRPDLLVLAFDRSYQFARRVLRVYQNTWPVANNWIGLRLRGRPGVSPIGARVLVVHAGGRQADAFVTGDSSKCQSALIKHFGLGRDTAVEFLEVRWPNGVVQRLDDPEINRYHDLSPPG